MVLDGHIKEILAMDFAPNGYVVAHRMNGTDYQVPSSYWVRRRYRPYMGPSSSQNTIHNPCP
jgi:hypothetical protein